MVGSSQDEYSACNGLGTAGGVCPAVLLPCSVASLHQGWESLEHFDCSVQLLRGFGWNSAITPVPHVLLQELRDRYPKLRYFATSRYETNNKPVVCKNPSVQSESRRHPLTSSSELLLLDRNLSILDSTQIGGGNCVVGRWRVCDARPFMVDRVV
ncbi:MAG: hypothetical protein SGPRY_006636 [Prymnesium sp.]